MTKTFYFLRVYPPFHGIAETRKKICMENLATMVRSCNENFVWRVWNHIWLLDMVAKKGQHGRFFKPSHSQWTLSALHIRNFLRIWVTPETFTHFTALFTILQRCSRRTLDSFFQMQICTIAFRCSHLLGSLFIRNLNSMSLLSLFFRHWCIKIFTFSIFANLLSLLFYI